MSIYSTLHAWSLLSNVILWDLRDSDARKFLKKYKTVEAAMNAYYDNPNEFGKPGHKSTNSSSGPSTTKLNALFDKYKESDSDSIAIDGTIQFCSDLGVDPEDVVLLPVAFELKSPRMGEWTRKEWVEGWKNLGSASLSMGAVLPRLRTKLASDPEYFKNVYNYTFNFAKQEGQRSIGLDTAQAFWQLLLPFGFKGGALSHVVEQDEDESGDVPMSSPEDGFKEEYIQWWFDFLEEKGGKGVSKDTWQMVRQFIRTIDSKFEKHDDEASWPSQIDDFVAYARGRLGKS
ncbi:defective in Cullin neddylation protein 1 [Flagelloscypha sp. PMI_526]|nr:defective in Cullin neddylation protein 1 [Flagelloscypha sp. PMI_526]